MRLFPLNSELWSWVLLLAVGLPLLVVLLGEIKRRLEHRNSPLAQAIGQLRHLLLPFLAIFLVTWQLLERSRSETPVRLLETVTWVTVIVVGLTLLNNITRIREDNPASWLGNVPALFFALSRAIIVLFVLYFILSDVWQIDVSSLFTAVGIGALAISFALQDTLSNLVSGLLLLVDRPFQVGDMIIYNGRRLRVQEVSWRATHCIDDIYRSSVVIPNGSLGGEVIENLGSMENSSYRIVQEISFSYNDLPNLVRQVVLDVLDDIETIYADPPPAVVLSEYGDFSIIYQMRYFISGWEITNAKDQVYRHVYYAALRNGLTFEYPIAVEYGRKVMPPPPLMASTTSEVLATFLRSIRIFAAIPDEALKKLADSTTLSAYGKDEKVVQQGEADAGLYVIRSGGVEFAALDDDGQQHKLARLIPGEIFGELALLRSDVSSPVSVTATTDTEVVIVSHSAVAELSEMHPRFGLEMNTFIEERQLQFAAVLGTDLLTNSQAPASTNWVELIRETA